MPACTWVQSPVQDVFPGISIFAPQSHKDFLTCPVLCGVGEHPVGSVFQRAQWGTEAPSVIAGVDSQDLLLRQELPENDWTQTPQLLNPADGRHPRFSLLQGCCPMWGQLWNRQGQS